MIDLTLKFFELLMHIDKYLQVIVSEYALLTYAIIFLIIFFETGIVVAPFLPGDSLLFAAGALAAIGSFNIAWLFLVIFLAAVLGDTLNYQIGNIIGPRIFTKESSWLFNRKYLVRAQHFYEKNGKKTIILARFIPIIRTFAPFVAGIGTMSYWVFLTYNILGALLWSGLFIGGGYLFGNIPLVKERFGLLVLVIIIISLMPLVKEVISYFLNKKRNNNLNNEN